VLPAQLFDRGNGTMSSFFDSGPLPDWKEIQKILGHDIPWKLVEKWDQSGDTDWLNQFVKDMMKKSKSEATVHTQGLVRMDAVKDAKHVNVTIRISPETELHRLQLFATSDRLMLTGLPNDKKRAIQLPCLVYARTGKAQLKKDQLLVRFRRRPPEKTEHELFIRS
jgi:HSP20 family molecular chaperone IbpA